MEKAMASGRQRVMGSWRLKGLDSRQGTNRSVPGGSKYGLRSEVSRNVLGIRGGKAGM